jgi:hypothetical protein
VRDIVLIFFKSGVEGAFMKKAVVIVVLCVLCICCAIIFIIHANSNAVDVFKKYNAMLYADPVADYESIMRNSDFSICFGDNHEVKKIFDDNRGKFESLIIQRITSKDASDGFEKNKSIYLAAYFKYTSAVKPILDQLLENNRIYGWEGPRYDNPKDFIDDSQYPYQCVYISAIEAITEKKIEDLKLLTDTDYGKLIARYNKNLPLKRDVKTTDRIMLEGMEESLVACWTLKKLGYDVELYN